MWIQWTPEKREELAMAFADKSTPDDATKAAVTCLRTRRDLSLDDWRAIFDAGQRWGDAPMPEIVIAARHDAASALDL